MKKCPGAELSPFPASKLWWFCYFPPKIPTFPHLSPSYISKHHPLSLQLCPRLRSFGILWPRIGFSLPCQMLLESLRVTSLSAQALHFRRLGSASRWLGRSMRKGCEVSVSSVWLGLRPIHSCFSRGRPWSCEATYNLWITTARHKQYG